MSGTYTTQTLKDTTTETVILLTGSASVAQSAVTVVTADTLLGGISGDYCQLNVTNIFWCISDPTNASVELIWDATTPVTMMILSGVGILKPTGGEPFTLPNPSGTGATGNIKLTTINFQTNDTYSIILHLKKTGPGWSSSTYS